MRNPKRVEKEPLVDCFSLECSNCSSLILLSSNFEKRIDLGKIYSKIKFPFLLTVGLIFGFGLLVAVLIAYVL